MKFAENRPVKIVMLGAGGTGGHIAPHLYRLLYALERPVRFILCDGDIVEEKNLVRQNFTPADLGENKAKVLAERYSSVFGMETEYVPEFIESGERLLSMLRAQTFSIGPYWHSPTVKELVILIGAVDNNKSRKLCHEVFYKLDDLIYIDSGNVYEQVFADIGDEQSIEQSLSTFSSHTKNIVEILKVCDKDSLVLFDELCAGTDPAEGAALAISIIEFCRKCGAGVAATTHYAELKLYAMRTSGVMNASCEFNVETLQPTYRLLIGVPGKSNAFAISKRLGIDEAILEQARSLVSQNDVNFEDVLTQLDQQRQEMEKAKEEAERLRRETEKQKEKSDEYYAQIKQEKEKAAQQARKEAQYIIDDARRAADAVYEELKQLRKQAKNGAFVPGSNEKQAQLRRSLNEAESRMQPQREEKQRPEPTRAIRVGDTVELLKLGTKASVLAINKDGSYQLRAGIMQITAKPEEVYLLENETQNAAKKVIAGKVRELKAAAQPELDIRGMAVDEALPVLDNFLDAAYMGNLPNARIIHGKGTGVLRAAVQEELRRCKYVKSFRLGVYGEGESGVTIVEFK